MSRRGWWYQVSHDEYPETKKSYGSSIATNWRPKFVFTARTEGEKKIKLQDKCPNCGRTYWIDKGCLGCGYPD